MLLNLIPHFNFATVRIPGVLQRIALCTLLAAPIVVYFDWRAAVRVDRRRCSRSTRADAVRAGARCAGRVAAGVLEPGRDFGALIDRLLLDGHLWAQSKTWDPGRACQHPAGAVQPAVRRARRALAAVDDSAQPRRRCGCCSPAWLCLWLGAILDATFMPINKSLWTPVVLHLHDRLGAAALRRVLTG